MANKMIKCKSCGADIAASAKACPKCGAKNKKPIYKKWWFYVLIVFVLVAVVGGTGGNDNATTSTSIQGQTTQPQKTQETAEPITYTHYNVTELFDTLKANAMKAQSTYKDQYVELEGFLGTIDSDGKYIGLSAGSNNYDYLFQEVQCYIKDEAQRETIMELNSGDPLIVRGKITGVGEVMGYSLNIDSIG